MTRTVETITGPLTGPEKKMLKQYEAEADSALTSINGSAVDLGRALADIQQEQLYRATGTFPEYVLARFGVSKSTAYRCIQVHNWMQDHPGLPAPALWELEPGKVAAKKAAAKAGVVPPVGQSEPTVIDAEWSDEVASEGADPADSPEATSTSQPESHVGLTASGGEADDDTSSGSAGSGPVAQLPQRTPGVVDGDDNSDEIGHVVEQWGAPTSSLRELSAQAAQTGVKESDDLLTDDEFKAAATIDSLILLLQSADMEALGRAMTADQIDTFGLAYQSARDAWTMAHKPVREMSRAQRARAKAATSPKSGEAGKCDHPKVAGHPAKAKGKWACGLCGEEVPVAAVSA
jgi:hypothetical protein